MLSVLSGHTDCVYSLLNKGANVEAKDKWGRTALHRGVRRSYHSYIHWHILYMSCMCLILCSELFTMVIDFNWTFFFTDCCQACYKNTHSDFFDLGSTAIQNIGQLSSNHMKCIIKLRIWSVNSNNTNIYCFLATGGDRSWGMCGGLASAQRQLSGARL